MNRFVIPYIDQPPAFWHDLADKYGDHIEEVYFPVPKGIIASGRSKQSEAHIEAFLQKVSLPKAVLVNPIILPEPIEVIAPRILNKLYQLHNDYGIESITLTNLDLARNVRQVLPSMKITASCLMGISTPTQVLMLQSHVDSLAPDTCLTHDLKRLQHLREAFNGKIRLLVNESCLPGCPLRTQHFYEMAYSTFFPHSLCQTTLEESPWLRMSSGWILPQHLHYYDGVFDSLKLAGRVTLQDPAKYHRILKAYIERTTLQPHDIGGGPASILAPVDIPDALFETILNCDKNCHCCTICRDFYCEQIAPMENA